MPVNFDGHLGYPRAPWGRAPTVVLSREGCWRNKQTVANGGRFAVAGTPGDRCLSGFVSVPGCQQNSFACNSERFSGQPRGASEV